MKHLDEWELDQQARLRYSLIGHGSLVMIVGLIAGIILVFSMVEGIRLWPFIDMDMAIPGSPRGWQAAHVGGMMNGLMMILMAMCVARLRVSAGQMRYIFWAFVVTGWANTIFYWCGNLSMNRALSVVGNRFGEGDIFGAIGYLAAAPAIVLIILGFWVIMKSSFSNARNAA